MESPDTSSSGSDDSFSRSLISNETPEELDRREREARIRSRRQFDEELERLEAIERTVERTEPQARSGELQDEPALPEHIRNNWAGTDTSSEEHDWLQYHRSALEELNDYSSDDSDDDDGSVVDWQSPSAAREGRDPPWPERVWSPWETASESDEEREQTPTSPSGESENGGRRYTHARSYTPARMFDARPRMFAARPRNDVNTGEMM
jgi:hypothetical protein